MTAATASIKVHELVGASGSLRRRFTAASAIFKGTMVCIATSGANLGKAVPASDAANLSPVVGIALNDATAGQDIYTQTGCFFMTNDALTNAAIDTEVYVKDDNTVKATGTNSVKAGVFRGIDTVTSMAIIELGTRA